ncbi:ABC transporter permease [Kroppenstedtia eburnea]|nr:ABC transporter permease [Kroppenstedtia eburnea]
MVLGVVLGPMIESNMRRALTGSNGDWLIFLQKPISLTFLTASILLLVVPLLLNTRKSKQNATEAV